MAVATTTALLIGAGIAAGSSVASAKMASGAAKGAAETQQESADKALALQQQMYQQERADKAPWRNVGGQAVQTLGGLMGLPMGPAAGQTEVGTGTLDKLGSHIPKLTDRMAYQADMGTVYGPAAGKAFPTSSSYPDQPPVHPGAQTASGYVTMEAPTGERQQVPREQMDYFQSIGAKVV